MVDAAEKLRRKVINAWCMYDWANSAFATTIMAAVLPTFYSSVAAGTLAPHIASAYWGYTTSFALFISAFASPILGALADYTGIKKRLLAGFALVGMFFTALLFLVSTGDWLMASLFFIMADLGFKGSIVFYDSLLPHVARPDEIDRVSTKGFALGYLGGGLLLAINLLMIMKHQWFFFPSQEFATRATFITVAIWWGVFSIPLLRLVPEPPARRRAGERTNPLKSTFVELGHTLSEIRKYRELSKFLIAFWVYNDGIGTIISMAVIYGKEIGIGTTDLVGALLLTQFVGIPFSILFGRLAAKFGTKRSITLALAVYALICVAGFFMSKPWHFWALAGAVGLVQGGSQGLSRSLFGVMAPKSKSGEFFGFYDVSSKIAGIVGPALFGVVAQLAGSSRLSIVSLIVFFVVGGALLATVDVSAGIRVAQDEEKFRKNDDIRQVGT
jgi:UMF1 family MFS transporter